MEPAKVANHYMRTWFFFNIILVTLDWISIIGISNVKNMYRIVRLLRLVKVRRLSGDIMEHVTSESFRIIADIAQLILCVLLGNHITACLWYYVGTYRSWEDSWVKASGLANKSLAYNYTTSLHWSLTQLTPASMEVVPRNALERSCTVFIVCADMVIFGSIVSNITACMTRLRNLNKARNDMYSALRRYMVENNISVSVSGAVWGYLHGEEKKPGRRLHEADVSALSILPKSLRSDLQHAVFWPVIGAHPFFHHLDADHPRTMRMVYRQTLAEVSVIGGQEVFGTGERSDRMFFCARGPLSYTKLKQSLSDKNDGVQDSLVSNTFSNRSSNVPGTDSITIEDGQWLCEPALWVDWKHQGLLTARRHSELISIRAVEFCNVFLKAGKAVPGASRYAAIYAEYVALATDVDDLGASLTQLADMAVKSFSQGEIAPASRTWKSELSEHVARLTRKPSHRTSR